MKSIPRFKLVFCVSLSLFFITAACSDDSTGPDLDEPPSLPAELTPATVDLSYFENQDVPADEDHSYYNTVEQIAYTGSGALMAGGMFNVASSFLAYAQLTGVKPELDGNTWIWTITIPQGMFKSGEESEIFAQASNDQITIHIHATPRSGGIDWEIRFTGYLDDDDFVDNFRLMTGFTSDDSMKGEWNFFLPESGNTPIISYNWEKESDTVLKMNITAVDNGNVVSVEYEKDGAENWITFSDGSDVVMAYWNENTDSGWFQDETGLRCHYENFENTGCS